MERSYIMFEKELLKATCVENLSTNAILEINGNIKVLYKYMYDRYMFFKSGAKEYYDNQEDIAESIGMSKRFVMATQKDLIAVGLLEKKATMQSGAKHSNSYVVHDVFNNMFKLHCAKKVVAKENKVVYIEDCDEEF